MDRRNFIRNTASFISLPLLINGQTLQVFGAGSYFNPEITDGRILVLIQLDGGNDGLNMLIPIDKYDNLAKLRPEVLLPENKIAGITEKQGLHPAMTEIQSLYGDEKIMFIQNVGYPQPNLSHFRSKEIINSASDSKTVVSSGWLGRYIETLHPGFPADYPNTQNPHPLAITIGSTSLPTCQGEVNNMAMVLQNLQTKYDAGNNETTFPDTPYGYELAYIAGVMESTEKYLTVITETASLSESKSTFWPASGSNSLADKLKIVARLISGGLTTPVYMLNMGGYDTHSGQVTEGQTELGEHANLLKKLSVAVNAFTDELKIQQKEELVIGMVFSEFGRRIKSNSSFGTDHGEAFPIMLFGNPVNPVVLGENPDILPIMDKDANVKMKTDFRSVYASVLYHWFKLGQDEIRTILFDDFEILPILKSSVANNPEIRKKTTPEITSVYPNPIDENAEIKFFCNGGPVQIKLINTHGRQSQILFSQNIVQGSHSFTFNRKNLPAGIYFIVIRENTGQNSIPVTLK